MRFVLATAVLARSFLHAAGEQQSANAVSHAAERENIQMLLNKKASPLGIGQQQRAMQYKRSAAALKKKAQDRVKPMKNRRQVKKTLTECDPNALDLGVLACGSDEFCVKNQSSSQGGFCSSRRLDHYDGAYCSDALPCGFDNYGFEYFCNFDDGTSGFCEACPCENGTCSYLGLPFEGEVACASTCEFSYYSNNCQGLDDDEFYDDDVFYDDGCFEFYIADDVKYYGCLYEYYYTDDCSIYYSWSLEYNVNDGSVLRGRVAYEAFQDPYDFLGVTFYPTECYAFANIDTCNSCVGDLSSPCFGFDCSNMVEGFSFYTCDVNYDGWGFPPAEVVCGLDAEPTPAPTAGEVDVLDCFFSDSDPVVCGFSAKNDVDEIAVCTKKAAKKGGFEYKTDCVDPFEKMKDDLESCGCCDEESDGKDTPDYCPTGTSAPITDAPTDAPISAPTPVAPTPVPVPPTAAPTAAPTDAPTDAPVGPSCEDDPDFLFSNEPGQDCDWVAKKADKRCIKEWNGTPLSSYCPLTCDACGSVPTEEPSSAPSTFVAPVPSSDAPTDPPAGASCEDDPDFLFSNEPGKDCDWVAKKADKRCIKEWNRTPLSSYCPLTCDACGSVPTEEPSSAPSIFVAPVPTVAAVPTVEPCVDDPDFLYGGKEGNDCDWAAKKPDNRCPKKYKNVPVSFYCPVACDSCGATEAPVSTDAPVAPVEEPTGTPSSAPVEPTSLGPCADDPDFLYGNKEGKDCDWVAVKPENRCLKKFKNILVSEFCPTACSEIVACP